ncbi:MAG: hypothetical protein HC876_21165 [Chloroflexaceae bacterium]|nr:hypothetical protein [Chloroflexaceae bacterium]NJO07824.1 hypothetical protein [Chloroflexaceae bacterium]
MRFVIQRTAEPLALPDGRRLVLGGLLLALVAERSVAIWHLPQSVTVEQADKPDQTLQIIDYTRLILVLLGLASLLLAVGLLLSRRRKHKTDEEQNDEQQNGED